MREGGRKRRKTSQGRDGRGKGGKERWGERG